MSAQIRALTDTPADIALGRALVREYVVATELGFTRMVLDVVPTRTRAIELYRSLGFVEIPRLHDYPFEMVAFAKELSDVAPDSLAG